MNYVLHYTFDELVNGQRVYEADYEYDIEQDFHDILKYLYKKRFRIEYDELSWQLENGAKDAVAEWNDKWCRNELRAWDFYSTGNWDFIDWLKGEYYDDAFVTFCREMGIVDYGCCV